jgi:isochorismate synthase EntC
VGAGITADSDPAAEWRETALKAETMLAVLGAEQTVAG